MSSPVSTRVESGVLVVTIERPEARNAINTVTAEAIGAAMDRLDSETTLVAGVITGAGGTFCAGMDLKAFLAGERPSIPGVGSPGSSSGRRTSRSSRRSRGMRWPAGSRSRSPATWWSPRTTPVRAAGGEARAGRRRGGLMRLLQKVPPGVAQEWALTGDLVEARRRTRWGWSTG